MAHRRHPSRRVRRSRRRARRSVHVRRRLTALVLGAAVLGAGAMALLAGADGPSDPAERPPGPLVLTLADGAKRSIPRGAFVRGGKPSPALLRHAVSRWLPVGGERTRGRATITVAYDRALTTERAVRAAPAGGTVRAAWRATASTIRAPVVAQKLHNDCESAALEVMLASTGHRIDQLRLQRALPAAEPLDPQDSGGGRVWGDPDLGFVGRPEGGGPAGGFGVYPGPVMGVAKRFGRKLDRLSGSRPERIYARLLAGRAVMAWIGLSAGPYATWRTPSGKTVRANFGEHTVVLAGIYPGGDVRVINPLEGTLERWSRAKFEAGWSLLGRRALGV